MKTTLFITAIIILASCSSEAWTGFYYPDGMGGDVNKWEIEDGFDSKQECLDWIDSIEKENENWDYECGKNCGDEIGITTCEVIEK